MSAGVVTFAAGSFPVGSSACFEAVKALSFLRPFDQLGASCNADPLVVGSVVTMTYNNVPKSVAYTVTAVTATPQSSVSDVGTLTVVLVIVALFFSGLIGYRIGGAS